MKFFQQSQVEFQENLYKKEKTLDRFENDVLKYNNKNGIEYIQFKKLLEFGITNAYTLKGENIQFRTDSEHEMESIEKLFTALDLDEKTRVKPLQRHTANIRCINRVMRKEELQRIDGLITDQKNITLCTTNADCNLILFYDPVNKVIGNIHSGWRGTFQKIAEIAVDKMINYYRCKPENIYAFLSPSIRKCHFEVDKDVRDLCEKVFSYTGRIDEFIEEGRVTDEGVQKYNIDTTLINNILLTDKGIKQENIIDSGLCSVCNSDKINSFRADGKDYQLSTLLITL